MIKEYIKKILFKLVLAERSAHKLALSFCVGNFIALSPTIPLQTPLAFLLSWIFRLNPTVVVTSLYLINNPFTMVPIYVINYMFGKWLFEKVLGLNLIQYNPSWVQGFNNFLSKYIDLSNYVGGSGLCMWCLLAGGCLLSLLISIALYPWIKRVFIKLLAQMEKKQSQAH
jgi:uncharacterized protein (DUF2062 family)